MKKHRGSKSGKPQPKVAGSGPTPLKDRSGKEHFTKRGGESRPNVRPPEQKNQSSRPGQKPTGPSPSRPSSRPSPRPSPRRPEPQRGNGGRGPRKPDRPRNDRGSRRQEAASQLKGTIDKNQKGFAFIIFASNDIEDAYLSPRDAASFLHGDRVNVSLSARGDVVDVQLIEHRFREMVGKYMPEVNRGRKVAGWLIYERRRAHEEVFIPEPPHGVKAGDWVRAQLQFHPASETGRGNTSVTGKIIKVYGAELPASSDIEAIAAEYSLFEEHPAKAVQEAQSFTLEVPGRDLQGRKDLRSLAFMTIDGETARDFDDAVFVERDGRSYVLWVAIADVSHYVREGSYIDKDARSRGTSVYFPERAFHMLPRALSEELCSLKPNVPRLTLVAKMKFHPNGTRETIELFEAVIQSQRRATYTEIAAETQQHGQDPNWILKPHLELYEILRKMRESRGSIDFDLPETEILVDANGEPTEVRKRERLSAHRLIEEFMIAANEGVTEWIMKKKWPFVYRVHEEPSEESLERFSKLAGTVGFQVKLDFEDAPPSVLAEIARKMQGHPAQLLLNNQLLRAMRQASYSSTHGIHYGLASKAYTHFTSPIRRYPDLVVHRMLRWALRSDADPSLRLKPQERDPLEAELAEIAEHCSYRERLATDAERESARLKQVRLLKKHLGQEFDATIIGMMEKGMFAQLDDPFVEGLIPRDSLKDDFYEFNEERMVFFGKRKRRTFKVGDRVKVQVARVDIEKRQADFALIDSPPGT